MADNKVVLCDVLCYLFANLGKTPIKPLKRVLLDYYQSSAISAAKILLLEHVKSLEKSVNLPHIPRRREGEGSAIKDVDDMFSIINFVDESKLFSEMPKFITDNPNNIPSGRIFEGDLKFIVERIDKLDDTLKGALAAILHELNQVRDLCKSKVMTSGLGCGSQQTQAKSVNNISGHTNPAHVEMTPSTHTAVKSAWGFPTTVIHPNIDSQVQLDSSSWAAATSHLALQSQTDTDGDTGDFTTAMNKKKRRRIQRNQHEATNQAMQGNLANNIGKLIATAKSNSTNNYKPLLVGRKQSDNGIVHELKAARKIASKSVFCVDNLDTAVTESDLKSFVSGLGVNVISCFSVRPRRSASQKLSNFTPANRHAFRLCVHRNDVDRLLDADVWPSDVTISKWFFKPRNAEDMDECVEPGSVMLHSDLHHSVDGGSLSGPSSYGATQLGAIGCDAVLQSSTLQGPSEEGNDGTMINDGETTVLYDQDCDVISNKNGE
jgi:hypothetical protein